MKIHIQVLALIFFFFGCSKENLSSPIISTAEKNRFVKVTLDDLEGTSKIMSRKSDEYIGDFVSRIWSLYGPPNSIDYEGFTYVFKDTKTNLIFSPYSAGSGPSYGGKFEHKQELINIINQFETLLQRTTPADCEIIYDTDYGTFVSGAKNGIPFDKEKEK